MEGLLVALGARGRVGLGLGGVCAVENDDALFDGVDGGFSFIRWDGHECGDPSACEVGASRAGESEKLKEGFEMVAGQELRRGVGHGR